jgi:hypothetical protein
MTQLREVQVLPPEVDVGEGGVAPLLGRLASRLAPELERSVGEVEWRVGDATGVDWTAEGFVDGVFVVVCLRPSTREVSLLVDTAFVKPSKQPGRPTGLVIGGIGAVGVAVGVSSHSSGRGIGAAAAIVAAWVCLDAVRLNARRRRAERSFDQTAWRRRFHTAIATALDQP